jgi:hypothetical protein
MKTDRLALPGAKLAQGGTTAQAGDDPTALESFEKTDACGHSRGATASSDLIGIFRPELNDRRADALRQQLPKQELPHAIGESLKLSLFQADDTSVRAFSCPDADFSLIMGGLGGRIYWELRQKVGFNPCAIFNSLA